MVLLYVGIAMNALHKRVVGDILLGGTNMLRRKKLNPISKKRQTIMLEYHVLIEKLRDLCGNVSELSGARPDWSSDYKVDPHHIGGREGTLLLDPFEIIMLVRNEHLVEQGQIPGDKKGKDYLLWLVKSIRSRQGW